MIVKCYICGKVHELFSKEVGTEKNYVCKNCTPTRPVLLYEDEKSKKEEQV